MRQVTATEFKSQFGDILNSIRDEPVEVLRGNKPIGIFLSHDDYQHLQMLDDAYWGVQAQAAVERGEFLTPEESMSWISQKLAK